MASFAVWGSGGCGLEEMVSLYWWQGVQPQQMLIVAMMVEWKKKPLAVVAELAVVAVVGNGVSLWMSLCGHIAQRAMESMAAVVVV
eukprot:11654024-Ditylum_brightwellii.AAC.1